MPAHSAYESSISMKGIICKIQKKLTTVHLTVQDNMLIANPSQRANSSPLYNTPSDHIQAH